MAIVLAPQQGVVLERLAVEIRWHEQQAQSSAVSAIEHKRQIGIRLLQAKDLLALRPFLEWGKSEFRWGQAHLYRHMAVARTDLSRVINLPADASWRALQAAVERPTRAVAVGSEAIERPLPPPAPPALDVPRTDYQLVLADPPWSYESWGAQSKGRVAADHYPTMHLDDICALPVGAVTDKSAVLLLWVTMPHLPSGLRVIESWGFQYKTCAFTWVKLSQNGSPAVGFGYYTRSNAELCLLATKGKGVAPRAKDIRSVLIDEDRVLIAPRRGHSAKPLGQYDAISRLFGRDVRCLELFARRRMPGWDVWGLEAPEAPTSLDLEMVG